MATWKSIKLMSGDGGGAFNVNSAHPFENPTPLVRGMANRSQSLAQLIIWDMAAALMGAAITLVKVGNHVRSRP